MTTLTIDLADQTALVEHIKTIVEHIDESQILELRQWLIAEPARRAERAAIEAAQVTLLADLAETAPELVQKHVTIADVLAGQEAPQWENPGGNRLRMYRPGGVVQHNGRHWVSEAQQLNSWEPGARGVHFTVWRDCSLEVEPPAPATDETGAVIPQGSSSNPWPFIAGIQVAAGDHVLADGILFKVLQPHTLAEHWAPAAVPALFERVEGGAK